MEQDGPPRMGLAGPELMTDFLTKAERSHRMSLIRGKDTRPERAMARLLRANKIGFRRHCRLPGTPDFVLKGIRIALFVDGDFWHGRLYDRCLKGKLNDFWRKKITGNMRRDKRVNARLRSHGWKVIRIWECDMMRRPQKCASKMLRAYNQGGVATPGRNPTMTGPAPLSKERLARLKERVDRSDDKRAEISLRHTVGRETVLEGLKRIRRKLCVYVGRTCDCKFGAQDVMDRTSEHSGCPEVAVAIALLSAMSNVEYQRLSRRHDRIIKARP